MLVELLTGVLFAGIAYTYFPFFSPLSFPLFFFFIFYALIACLAVVITVYDIRHMIIPDAFVFSWIALGIILQAVMLATGNVTGIPLLDILAGPILFTFFWALWYFSRGTWMGFGDAKLALAIGLTLGFSQGITAIVLGFWIGAIYGVAMIVLSKLDFFKKKIGMRTEVPFGPFLILGFFLSLFWNLDLMWMAHLFVMS
jgi:leader peptidase (prepilin peptidase)/N-methyltransferase